MGEACTTPLEVLVSLHRSASRGGPLVAGLTAVALLTIWGQPAAGTATHTTRANTRTSAVNAHPYASAHRRSVRLVKVSRPSASPVKSGAPRIRRHLLPELQPPSREAGGRHLGKLAPHVRSTKVSKRRSGRLIAEFDGVNAIQNGETGFVVEPPDEGLGAGHGFVANFVNVTGAIYNRHGGMVQGPFFLNTFFGESPAANTSDPRVYYDSDSGRWFATMLVYTFNADFTAVTESHIDIAASKHRDPTKAWRVYRLDASSPGHRGCPCLGDYPILGVDGHNLYISTQEFTADFSEYNGAQLYILPKSELTAGASTVHLASFENLEAGGSLAFRVQFANALKPSPAEFAMSTLDPTGSGDNRIAVWAVTHRRAVAHGGMPSLSTRVISSEGYFQQPLAQTPPGFCDACTNPLDQETTGLVDTGPDSMFETQYIHGSLVGALGTGLNIAGDSGPRAGIGWLVVSPHIRHGRVASSTHVARQGYVATRGLDVFYPHVNMTRNGSMALAFGLGGPNTFLSAATALAHPGHGFGRIRLVEAGVTADNGFTGTDTYGGVGRWGDYSNGQLVGHTNRVWLATQYIPNEGDGAANWGNRIWGLRLH
jgi:hypothetical protein